MDGKVEERDGLVGIIGMEVGDVSKENEKRELEKEIMTKKVSIVLPFCITFFLMFSFFLFMCIDVHFLKKNFLCFQRSARENYVHAVYVAVREDLKNVLLKDLMHKIESVAFEKLEDGWKKREKTKVLVVVLMFYTSAIS